MDRIAALEGRRTAAGSSDLQHRSHTRQRGRKRILAPDGRELTPPTKPQPDGVLGKALARVWRWQKMLDRGAYCSLTGIAEAGSISESYVSRILRLALRAPQIVEVSWAAGRTSG